MMNDDDNLMMMMSFGLEIRSRYVSFFVKLFFFNFFFFKKERTTNNNQKSKDRREQFTRRFSCTSATGAGQRSRTRRTSLDAGISSVRRVFFFSSSRERARVFLSLSLSLSHILKTTLFSHVSRALFFTP